MREGAGLDLIVLSSVFPAVRLLLFTVACLLVCSPGACKSVLKSEWAPDTSTTEPPASEITTASEGNIIEEATLSNVIADVQDDIEATTGATKEEPTTSQSEDPSTDGGNEGTVVDKLMETTDRTEDALTAPIEEVNTADSNDVSQNTEPSLEEFTTQSAAAPSSGRTTPQPIPFTTTSNVTSADNDLECFCPIEILTNLAGYEPSYQHTIEVPQDHSFTLSNVKGRTKGRKKRPMSSGLTTASKGQELEGQGPIEITEEELMALLRDGLKRKVFSMKGNDPRTFRTKYVKRPGRQREGSRPTAAQNLLGGHSGNHLPTSIRAPHSVPLQKFRKNQRRRLGTRRLLHRRLGSRRRNKGQDNLSDSELDYIDTLRQESQGRKRSRSRHKPHRTFSEKDEARDSEDVSHENKSEGPGRVQPSKSSNPDYADSVEPPSREEQMHIRMSSSEENHSAEARTGAKLKRRKNRRQNAGGRLSSVIGRNQSNGGGESSDGASGGKVRPVPRRQRPTSLNQQPEEVHSASVEKPISGNKAKKRDQSNLRVGEKKSVEQSKEADANSAEKPKIKAKKRDRSNLRAMGKQSDEESDEAVGKVADEPKSKAKKRDRSKLRVKDTKSETESKKTESESAEKQDEKMKAKKKDKANLRVKAAKSEKKSEQGESKSEEKQKAKSKAKKRDRSNLRVKNSKAGEDSEKADDETTEKPHEKGKAKKRDKSNLRMQHTTESSQSPTTEPESKDNSAENDTAQGPVDGDDGDMTPERSEDETTTEPATAYSASAEVTTEAAADETVEVTTEESPDVTTEETAGEVATTEDDEDSTTKAPLAKMQRRVSLKKPLKAVKKDKSAAPPTSKLKSESKGNKPRGSTESPKEAKNKKNKKAKSKETSDKKSKKKKTKSQETSTKNSKKKKAKSKEKANKKSKEKKTKKSKKKKKKRSTRQAGRYSPATAPRKVCICFRRSSSDRPALKPQISSTTNKPEGSVIQVMGTRIKAPFTLHLMRKDRPPLKIEFKVMSSGSDTHKSPRVVK